MSLFSEIKNQANALGVHTQCLKTTAKNISNLHNPNFSRESVSIAQAGSIKMGAYTQDMGIVIKDIRQSRDSFLDQQVNTQAMLRHGLSAQEKLGRILELKIDENVQRTGDPTTIGSIGLDALNSNGLSMFIDNFFNTLQELSGNPLDMSNRQILLEKAGCLCEKFNQLAKNFEELDSSIESYKDNETYTVNNLLSKIADINNEIILAKGNQSLGADLDYINQRQATLEELSQYINFEVREEPNPVATGQPIYKLILPDGTPDGLSLLQGSQVLNTLHYKKEDKTFFIENKQALQTEVTILGGRLNGYSSFQDNLLKPLSDNTDALARQMTKSINEAYGANFFDVSAEFEDANFADFGAKDMRLNPNLKPQTLITTTQERGNNDVLIKMIDTYNFSHTQPDDSISGSFQEYHRNNLSSFGEKLNNLDKKLENENMNELHLKNRREALMGVSLDEESANMSLFQKAYNATASVIGILSSCLDTIIALGSRR